MTPDRRDQPATATLTSARPLAERRAFRSKVDTIRPDLRLRGRLAGPGTGDLEPADVDLGAEFAGIELAIPILAAAMDAVVDPRFAGVLARLGGLAVLNLEGVQTRYDDPAEVLERIATAPDDEAQAVLAEAYRAPIRDDLVARRIEEIHAAGSQGRRRRDAGRRPPVRAVLRGARRRPVPRPVAGLVGAPPRDRLRPARAGRVHALHADPGRRRQHDRAPRPRSR